jgi:hypothetical protein
LTSSDEALENFFKIILNKNNDTIHRFLDDYPAKIVIEHLLNEIQNTGDAWKLGRVFGTLERQTKRYTSTDSCIYLRYKTCSVYEKVNILDFLSGYWDSVGAKLGFAIEIGDEMVKAISTDEMSEWDKNSLLLGIPLVVLSYLNNKSNIGYEKELMSLAKIITILKAHVSIIAPQSSTYRLLQKF